MKTKYLFMMLVAVLMGTQVMNAQNNDERGKRRGNKRITMEQMVSMQSRRIIQDLGLDDKTAAKFTDVYKKYMTEMNDLRKKNIPKKTEAKPGEKKVPAIPTDAEVDEMMRDRFKQSRKMLDIREKYYDEFRKFLSPKQVQKIFEKGQMNRGKFDKEMNRRANMKHQQGGRQHGGPQK